MACLLQRLCLQSAFYTVCWCTVSSPFRETSTINSTWVNILNQIWGDFVKVYFPWEHIHIRCTNFLKKTLSFVFLFTHWGKGYLTSLDFFRNLIYHRHRDWNVLYYEYDCILKSCMNLKPSMNEANEWSITRFTVMPRVHYLQPLLAS